MGDQEFRTFSYSSLEAWKTVLEGRSSGSALQVYFKNVICFCKVKEGPVKAGGCSRKENLKKGAAILQGIGKEEKILGWGSTH